MGSHTCSKCGEAFSSNTDSASLRTAFGTLRLKFTPRGRHVYLCPPCMKGAAEELIDQLTEKESR